MALGPTSTSFSKCAPSYATDIARCGTVTVCNAIPLNTAELTSTFMDSTNFRLMEPLFEYDIELKQCQADQKGLADFLMANKFDSSKKIQSKRMDGGLYQIVPFFEAKRRAPINNEYWAFTGGIASDADGTPNPAGIYWYIVASSTTSMPADIRWFLLGDRVYLDGLANDGTSTKTAYTITLATVASTTVQLVLLPQNAGSFLPAARIAKPVTGVLVRGTKNVSDYEAYCLETPGLNTNSLVPFWMETTRMAMCRSENYNKWRALVFADNPLFRIFGDIPEIELNKQQADDFKKRFLNNVLWSKPLNANQTMALYRSLPEITIPAGSVFSVGSGECQGKRANVVGLYEQHAECSRVVDLQGARLNLQDLFESLRLMQRVRQANGSKAASNFDIFTDQVTAKRFRTAMLAYYKAESQNMLEMHINLETMTPKEAPMGFKYNTYELFYPSVKINVIWDEAFDDRLTAFAAAGIESAGRELWILDWTMNYVTTLMTNKTVNETGKLQTLAQGDPTLACVMKLPTKETTMYSHTYAVVSECPSGDLIISNFDANIPEAVTPSAPGASYG